MKSEKHLTAQRMVGVLFVALMALSFYGIQTSPVAAALARGERIPVLLFGTDAADASHHTDTIMISVLNPLKNNLSLLSLPRDTRINLPGYLFHRINEIYGYHLRKSKDRAFSAEKVVEGVEYTLSSEAMGIKIPYWLQVDYDGFKKIIDIVGGVRVTIKQPMHYDDKAGNYHFHKEPGTYVLKGQEALFYARFRGATGDRGRILRQHEFLRNLAKQFANPLNVVKFPQIVGAVNASIRTNLTFWDVLSIAVAARRVRSKSLDFYILPGRPRGAYWVLNKEAVNHLAGKMILGVGTGPQIETIVPQMDRVTVNVWNASGQKGLAYQVTKFLRECGYDVIDWGTYPAEQAQTRVFDRTGELSRAKEVAMTLGVDDFHSELNTKRMVDVEVVLGQNYNGVGGKNN